MIPRSLALLVARAAGDACFVLLRSRRVILESNLVRTAPQADAPERRRLARRTFRWIATIWMDVLRLPSMSRAEITGLLDARCAVETRAVFDAALSEGRGAVIVSPHLGGMELSGAYLAASGWPVTSVAEDIAPRDFEVLRRYRTTSGLRLLPQRRSGVPLFRALQRGEVVAIVADRLIEGSSTAVDFCGGRRLMPTGPAELALKAGAPLLVGCMAREGNERLYTGLCRRVPLESGDPVEVTRAIAGAFSEFVQRYPDQWFVFQPEWIVDDGADVPAPATSSLAVRVP